MKLALETKYQSISCHIRDLIKSDDPSANKVISKIAFLHLRTLMICAKIAFQFSQTLMKFAKELIFELLFSENEQIINSKHLTREIYYLLC